MGVLAPIFIYVVAFCCTIGAIALAVLHIYRHLLNYTEPTYQRFIVRIIFMVPVYALMSFLSLVAPKSSIYFNSIREVCNKFERSGSEAIDVSDDLLLSSYTVGWGVLFFLAAKTGFIKNADEAALLQNFIICVEMLVAAVGHFYAFPYKEYAGANIGESRGLTASLGHALKLNDFYHDTVHQFAPTYHDYVLYNHSEGEEGTRKYRSRTFVPIGPEMDTVRKNKYVFGNKLDDIQLSSMSSSNSSTPSHSDPMPDPSNSDAMKSSLLLDMSNSVSVPYDLTLIDLDVASYPENVPAADKAGTR
ncbi:hypothetical protein TanjilG_32863 [Lupinus angustifolius]|uniref:Uncharacterized protein n=1 Tax=Lupinus angustifolius TaxID=3871 RepID=A0A4P1RSQ9_LUPAN|nr:hypothetical protein TanjilG_32863 [Lupinus angustifolius]